MENKKERVIILNATVELLHRISKVMDRYGDDLAVPVGVTFGEGTATFEVE